MRPAVMPASNAHSVTTASYAASAARASLALAVHGSLHHSSPTDATLASDASAAVPMSLDAQASDQSRKMVRESEREDGQRAPPGEVTTKNANSSNNVNFDVFGCETDAFAMAGVGRDLMGGDTSSVASSCDIDAALYDINEEDEGDDDDDDDDDVDGDVDHVVNDSAIADIDDSASSIRSDGGSAKRVRWCPVLSSTLPYYFYDAVTGEALEGRAAREQAKRDVLGDNWEVCFFYVCDAT
jgi:hypothetical protein